jgi:3-methyladenine DNA glycosylase AlkD
VAQARVKAERKRQTVNVSATQFVKALESYSSPEEAKKISRTLKLTEGSRFIGARMGQVFALAKEFVDMPLSEIEKLLDSDIHEVRVGAVSVMDFQAREKKFAETHRRELYELYLRRHDRIDNWDLVDIAAPYVVGGWLREAGKKDPKRLLKFLDQHASIMPRTALRYATEHLDKRQREHYSSVKRGE